MYDKSNDLSVATALKRISIATVGAICLTLGAAGTGRAIITSGAPNDPMYITQLGMFSSVGLIKSPIPETNQKTVCTDSRLNGGDNVLTIAHCTREYARTLKAVSGPDDKGRWRFNSPYGAPTGAMESQGCEFATFSEPSYRCPEKTIEVQDTRTLRTVSGPDNKGRWRFNSPGSDVPSGAMESQGCEDVTPLDEPSWRCPEKTIAVPVKP